MPTQPNLNSVTLASKGGNAPFAGGTARRMRIEIGKPWHFYVV